MIVEKYGVNELRKMFLDFFKSKGSSGYEQLFSCTAQ